MREGSKQTDLLDDIVRLFGVRRGRRFDREESSVIWRLDIGYDGCRTFGYDLLGVRVRTWTRIVQCPS